MELRALEEGTEALCDILLEHGDVTVRSLGQKYSAMHGQSFKKATGLTLSCFLHSAHGTAFIVRNETKTAGRDGKVLPVKDWVSLAWSCRPNNPPRLARVRFDEPAEKIESPMETLEVFPSARETLEAARKSLKCALVEVEHALATLSVKNTFLEFLPPRLSGPKRQTSPPRFAGTAGLAALWDNEPEEDADEAFMDSTRGTRGTSDEEEEEEEEPHDVASPHSFPEEYDLVAPYQFPQCIPERASLPPARAPPQQFCDTQLVQLTNMPMTQAFFVSQQQVAALQAQVAELQAFVAKNV